MKLLIALGLLASVSTSLRTEASHSYKQTKKVSTPNGYDFFNLCCTKNKGELCGRLVSSCCEPNYCQGFVVKTCPDDHQYDC